MEDRPNTTPENIAIGALVEARDGMIGTVSGVVTRPETGELVYLVVQNEDRTKQFTLPANLIARQVGSRVVHLSILRDQVVNYSEDTQMDTNTANIGQPSPPMPE